MTNRATQYLKSKKSKAARHFAHPFFTPNAITDWNPFKSMKTLRRFSHNRFFSHLRISAAVTFLAAAAVSAIATFTADPEARLTNDDQALTGYPSNYTLSTVSPFTD